MEEGMTEAVEPLGSSRAWEARGLGVMKQNTQDEGHLLEGKELGLLPSAPSSRRQPCPRGA